MQVIELLETEFKEKCSELCDNILSDYRPELVIGILTGGGAVARIVVENFDKKVDFLYTELRVVRPSTSLKKQINVGKMLSFLPTWLLNKLRILEVVLLELKSKIVTPHRIGVVTFDENVDRFLRKKNSRILIIDDCIDTGATLKLVEEQLVEKYGNLNEIRFAVITKAHKKPIVEVNYFLYDRVLIRFPWSFDTKL